MEDSLLKVVVRDKTVSILPQGSAGNARARVERLTHEIEVMQTSLERKLFPLEVGAKQSLRATIAEKQDALRALERVHRASILSAKYRSFVPDALTHRDHEGMPRLVIYDVERDAPFTLRFDRLVPTGSWSSRVESPELPAIMIKHYVGITPPARMVKEASKTGGQTHFMLSSVFRSKKPKDEPVIPKEARVLITKAKPDFDRILLVAEASEWTLHVPAPPKVDPLIIGVKEGLCWYIGAFDITKFEKWIESEFAIWL